MQKYCKNKKRKLHRINLMIALQQNPNTELDNTALHADMLYWNASVVVKGSAVQPET